jgi:L-alanine-DL-glutamate epimerase-like enolase superfamily enzyme
MLFSSNLFDDVEIKFDKAEIYTFCKLTNDLYFRDGTTEKAHNLAPLGSWLKLYDSEGTCGIVPCGKFMIDIILPNILTGEKKTYKEWYKRLYWAVRNLNFNSREASEVGNFDMAVHDIMAQKAGLPLHKFLGATRDTVQVYASGVSCFSTDEQIVDEVSRYRDEKFNYLKMKVGTNFGADFERDVYRVKLVRETIGNDMKLAIDANQAWSAEEALKFAKAVEKYNIDWFEEPINTYDYAGFKELSSKSPIPISTGECFSSGLSFDPLVDAGVKHFQPIPTKVMSVGDWMHVRDIAEARGIRVSSGGYSQISAACVATCKDDDNSMVEWLLARRRILNQYFALAPEVKEGRFYLPKTPGLPLRLDFEKLKRERLIEKIQYFYAK